MLGTARTAYAQNPCAQITCQVRNPPLEATDAGVDYFNIQSSCTGAMCSGSFGVNPNMTIADKCNAIKNAIRSPQAGCTAAGLVIPPGLDLCDAGSAAFTAEDINCVDGGSAGIFFGITNNNQIFNSTQSGLLQVADYEEDMIEPGCSTGTSDLIFVYGTANALPMPGAPTPASASLTILTGPIGTGQTHTVTVPTQNNMLGSDIVSLLVSEMNANISTLGSVTHCMPSQAPCCNVRRNVFSFQCYLQANQLGGLSININDQGINRANMGDPGNTITNLLNYLDDGGNPYLQFTGFNCSGPSCVQTSCQPPAVLQNGACVNINHSAPGEPPWGLAILALGLAAGGFWIVRRGRAVAR
jgi:hypothetical protein